MRGKSDRCTKLLINQAISMHQLCGGSYSYLTYVSKGSQGSFPLMKVFMRECCSNCHTNEITYLVDKCLIRR